MANAAKIAILASGFAGRSFITTRGMYGLIAREIGVVALLLGGFVYTQFLQ